MYHFVYDYGEKNWYDYIRLIRCCVRCCTHLSFVFSQEQLFAHYQLPVVPYLCKAIREEQNCAPEDQAERFQCYYLCTEDVVDYLNRHVKSLFDWVRDRDEAGSEKDNPEDLTFYRVDGSVFFRSVTHKGECWLFPQEGEFVGDVVSNPGWEKIDGEQCPLPNEDSAGPC